MKFYKTLHYFSLIATLLLNLSCSSDVDDINSNKNNSSFTISQVEAISINSSSYKTWPDLNTKTTYNLKTCVKNRMLSQNITGEKFIISGEEKTQQLITDSEGCIYWNESISFNYLEDEGYYPIQRMLVGTSNYKGVIEINLNLNPWDKLTTSSLIDLTKEKQSQEKLIKNDFTNSLKSSPTQSLYIDNINISLLNEDYSSGNAKLTVLFEMPISFSRIGLHNNEIMDLLSGGKFLISSNLIERNILHNKRTILAEDQTVQQINNGLLSIKSSFILSKSPELNSKLEFSLNLIPQETPFKIPSLKGSVIVDNLKESMRKQFIVTNNNQTINAITLPTVFNNQFGFQFAAVNVSKGEYIDYQEDNKQMRSINAKIDNLCLLNPISKKPISNYDVGVALNNKHSNQDASYETIRLNNDGCLSFTKKIIFDLSSKKGWHPFSLEIKGSRPPYFNFYSSREVWINPRSNDTNIGIDSVHDDLSYISKDDLPQIVLKDLSYTYLGNDELKYKLNKYLEMKLEKKYNLKLTPQIKTYSSDEQKIIYQNINSGKFKLRYAILSPVNMDANIYKINLNHFRTISASEKTVIATEQGINTVISLPFIFSEMIHYPSRNVLLLEIIPLNKNSHKKPTSIATSFWGTGHQFSTGEEMKLKKTFIVTSEYISSHLDNSIKMSNNKLAQKKLGISPFILFQHQLKKKEKEKVISQLSLLTVSNFNKKYPLKKINSQLSDSLTQDPNCLEKKDIKRFCSLIYKAPTLNDAHTKDKTAYFKCLKSPRKHLSLTPVIYIERIVPEQQVTAKNELQPLFKGEAFLLENYKGKSTYNIQNKSLGINYSSISKNRIALPLFGGPYTKFEIINIDSTLKDLKGLANDFKTTKLDLNSEQIELQFQADLKYCVLIFGNYNQLVKSNKQLPISERSKRVVQICRDEIDKDISLSEYWYQIGERNRKIEPVILDSFKPDETEVNTITQTIRGIGNIAKYKKLLMNNGKTLILNKFNKNKDKLLLDPRSNLQNSSIKNKMNTTFPGMIIPRIN